MQTLACVPACLLQLPLSKSMLKQGGSGSPVSHRLMLVLVLVLVPPLPSTSAPASFSPKWRLATQHKRLFMLDSGEFAAASLCP